MQDIKAERGYLIPAFGKVYENCAVKLKHSILEWHPDADITIVTTHDLPYGDLGGFANDWQLFEMSPYRQTIKLEADMYCASEIDHWWSLLEKKDVVISKGCRDIYNRVSNCRSYRRIFDDNNFPDVYNAITYWRRSHTAAEFFQLVKNIFENWNDYKKMLKFPDDEPTTDVVYAIAAIIIGVENVTLPDGFGPSIVHMKKHILGLVSEDWTKELVWEFTNPGLRIQTVVQQGLVHYYIKEWADEISSN